nr:hypothetical protein GCM10020093_050910 [Planobispora longispora]
MEDLKQLFLRSVNHELRTPLTSIRSYLQLIQDDETELDPGTEQRFLDVIERNSDRLLERLDELLLLASLSAQTAAFAPGAIDLSALTSTVVAEAETKAEPKRHTLILDAPRPVVAWADASRLRHALVHLLDNAIKFTPPAAASTWSSAATRSRRWRSVTPGSASARPRPGGSSTTSTARPRPRSTRSAGSEWACPSSGGSSPCTAVTCA